MLSPTVSRQNLKTNSQDGFFFSCHSLYWRSLLLLWNKLSVTPSSANPQKMTNRLPLDPPKQWGMTDAELAVWPLSFRDDALAGQVCVVSGGGSGMGRAIAYVLTRLGAQGVICGRRPEMLGETGAGVSG